MLTTQLSNVPEKHENSFKMHMISTLNVTATVFKVTLIHNNFEQAGIHSVEITLLGRHELDIGILIISLC